MFSDRMPLRYIAVKSSKAAYQTNQIEWTLSTQKVWKYVSKYYVTGTEYERSSILLSYRVKRLFSWTILASYVYLYSSSIDRRRKTLTSVYGFIDSRYSALLHSERLLQFNLSWQTLWLQLESKIKLITS